MHAKIVRVSCYIKVVGILNGEEKGGIALSKDMLWPCPSWVASSQPTLCCHVAIFEHIASSVCVAVNLTSPSKVFDWINMDMHAMLS